MSRLKVVICCAWLLLVTAGTSSAKGWRGLIPLHSTRQDVERLLGTSKDPYYNLSDETVQIDFSSGACESAGPDGYNVPANTITRILVIPKWEPSLDALIVDLTAYKKEVDENIKEHVFYNDEEAGEYIEVFDGKVESITYTPLAAEASLRCYSSFGDWMTANNVVCILPAQKFDQFGALSPSDERARLINFANQLKSHSPNSRGWIIVYGIKKDRREDVVKHAKKIKNFLVRQQGLAPGRVLTLAAGPLDEPRVDVWISFAGHILPPPSTLRDRE